MEQKLKDMQSKVNRLQRKNAELFMMADAIQSFATAKSVEQIIDRLLEFGAQLTGARQVFFLSNNESSRKLEAGIVQTINPQEYNTVLRQTKHLGITTRFDHIEGTGKACSMSNCTAIPMRGDLRRYLVIVDLPLPENSEEYVELLSKITDPFVLALTEKGYSEQLLKSEKSLRESEQRWATTLMSIGDAVIATDVTGRVTFMNRMAEGLTGWSLDEASGKQIQTVFNIVNEQTKAPVDNPVFKVLEKGVTVGLANHTMLIRKNNSGVPIDDSAAPIKDKDGKVTGVVLVFRDISGRKKAEEDLFYSNERLSLISSVANQLLTTSKPQTIIQDICMKVMAFLNCDVFFNFLVDTQRGRLHLNAYAGVPVDVAETFEWLDFGQAVCGCAAKEGKRIVCENIPDSNDERAALVRSFGVKAYVANPIFSEDRVIGTLSFGSKSKPVFTQDDLSLMNTVAAQVSVAMERQNAEEKLKRLNEELELRVIERTKQVSKERQRLYSILETLPVYVVLLDKDYRMPFVNKVFRERFGESNGRRCHEYLFNLNSPCENCETYKVLQSCGPHHWEWTGPDNRNYDIYDFPFVEADGSILILEMGIDVTERKRAEEKAQESARKLRDTEKLAAIGATAGMVGHDIRNPLQAITSDIFLAKSELYSLSDCNEKKNALESMDEIEKNVDYINKIVQDLQDYARPLNPKIEETDLNSIINSFFARNGLPENVEVSLKISDDARKIRADGYYLNRILYNLITNAVQAMPQGGRITIEAKKEADATVLTVDDTGVGVPKSIQDKMFTLMFTTKSKGQGFGLPVVKRMTESLGGTVTFESQEGKGTTFTVRIPT